MANFINQETCKKCKLCIEICPVNIIGVDSNSLVNFIPERESICLKCGQCMAVCHTNSIKIEGYSYEKNFLNKGHSLAHGLQPCALLTPDNL